MEKQRDCNYYNLICKSHILMTGSIVAIVASKSLCISDWLGLSGLMD